MKVNLITPIVDLIDFNLMDFENMEFYFTLGKVRRKIKITLMQSLPILKFFSLIDFISKFEK